MSEVTRRPVKRVLDSSSIEEMADILPQTENSSKSVPESEIPLGTKTKKTAGKRQSGRGEMSDLAGFSQPQRQKKSKQNEVLDLEKYAYDVIKDMKDMYGKDVALAAAGEPAVTRLNNVEGIAARILRRNTQDACIRLGVLNEVRRWLEPLNDKSLPNQKIKKVLLDLLYSLKITKDDLYSSEVGKIVHFYSKNGKEARDVRRMASRLIKKWKNLVIREGMQDE